MRHRTPCLGKATATPAAPLQAGKSMNSSLWLNCPRAHEAMEQRDPGSLWTTSVGDRAGLGELQRPWDLGAMPFLHGPEDQEPRLQRKLPPAAHWCLCSRSLSKNAFPHVEKGTCGQFHPAPDRATTFHHSPGSQSEWFCSAKRHRQGVAWLCLLNCTLTTGSAPTPAAPYCPVARNGLSPRAFTACRRGTRSQMNPAHLVVRCTSRVPGARDNWDGERIRRHIAPVAAQASGRLCAPQPWRSNSPPVHAHGGQMHTCAHPKYHLSPPRAFCLRPPQQIPDLATDFEDTEPLLGGACRNHSAVALSPQTAPANSMHAASSS